MTRSMKWIFAGCLAFLCVTVAFVWQLPTPAPVAPSLSEALQDSGAGRPTRLYSGAVDSKTGQPVVPQYQSYDVVNDGIVVANYVQNKDGTSRDTFYQSNGIGLSYVRQYFPIDAKSGVRRIRALVIYDVDGKRIRKEIWWRFDGTREKIGHLLDAATGRYETMTLFSDGNTAETSRITQANPYANNFEPKLLLERRWFGNAGHTLAWVDTLNEDGTRDQTSYDELGNPLLVKHIGRWGKVGTTVKFFFPGEAKVRLESATDANTTTLKAYRIDGSVLYMQRLDSTSSSIVYLDEQGKPLFEQQRWKNNVVENGKPVEIWPIWKITEFEGAIVKREFAWRNGKLDTETSFNATVDGVFYEKVIRTYREDGTLQRVDMLEPKSNKRVVEYSVEQNMRADIPAKLMAMPEFPDEVPVPEAQSYGPDR